MVVQGVRETQAQLEKLRPQDRPQVEQLAEQTQQGFEQLLKALEPYPKARAYIENLIQPVTTFFGWWLQKGEAFPLTTNAVESHFSRICNRVKRIGRRWSDRGLLNWLTVNFYKIFKPELWSLQTAIFMPVAMAFVSDLHEESKGEKLGWFSTATLLGRFLAPLAGGALLGFLGSSIDQAYTSIYFLCLVGGAFALFLTLKVPRPENSFQQPKNWKDTAAGLSQLVSSGPLLSLAIVEASVLFMYGTIEVFLPLYALSRGIGTFEIGACLSAQVITLAATKPVMGKFSDQHGRSGQIVWGSLLGVAAAASMAYISSFIGILSLSVLIGLSLSIVTSATSAAVADISRCDMRGSAMGIFGTIMDVGHSAGPLVSGVVAAYLGYQAAFVGAAIVLAGCTVAFSLTAFNKLNPCGIPEQL